MREIRVGIFGVSGKMGSEVVQAVSRADGMTTVGGIDLKARPAAQRSDALADASRWGYGRELFSAFRHMVTTAEQGATVCYARSDV